jgi:hypothetical protein
MFTRHLSQIGGFRTINTYSVNKLSLYKFNLKGNFDQHKDRPKRHFMVLYKFIEDMHYKRVPYKEDHQKLIEQFEQNGSVVLGGN